MILHPHTLVVFALLKNSKKTLFCGVRTLFLVVQWKQSGGWGEEQWLICPLCHSVPSVITKLPPLPSSPLLDHKSTSGNVCSWSLEPSAYSRGVFYNVSVPFETLLEPILTNLKWHFWLHRHMVVSALCCFGYLMYWHLVFDFTSTSVQNITFL